MAINLSSFVNGDTLTISSATSATVTGTTIYYDDGGGGWSGGTSVKPKPESALDWLDRRVRELQVKL